MRQFCIALVIALSVSGCGHLFGTSKASVSLLDRRDAEQVLADRDRMVTEISAALARTVPGTQWRATKKEFSTGCGEGYSADGNLYFGPHYSATAPIPDSSWDQAAQVFTDIAAKYGYTDASRNAQYQTVTIKDADGGRLLLVAEFFDITTGCFLTAEEKRKARDAAPK